MKQFQDLTIYRYKKTRFAAVLTECSRHFWTLNGTLRCSEGALCTFGETSLFGTFSNSVRGMRSEAALARQGYLAALYLPVCAVPV